MAELRDKALQFRLALVERLREQNLLDAPLEAAFKAIPRHLFLPGETIERAYTDEAIVIKRDADGTILSSSSQPSMMALMLRQLRLREGDNVLEIGTGSGYNAAIMQHLIGESGTVTSVELDPQLAQQAEVNLQRARLSAIVNVVQADGAMGYAPRASYDGIICTTAMRDVPVAWQRQLKTSGVLVVPLWVATMQVSTAFTLQGDGSLYSRHNIPCGFIPARGMAAGARTSVRVGSSLLLSSLEIAKLDSTRVQLLLNEDMETSNIGMPLDSASYWRSFLPFLVLNVPEGCMFVLYQFIDGHQGYGMEGGGFALIAPGSASFVPYDGDGRVHVFGSADTYIALRTALDSWEKHGKPGVDRLRLLLTDQPDSSSIQPNTPNAQVKVYSIQYHTLRVWMDLA